jgi:hypothetical protein
MFLKLLFFLVHFAKNKVKNASLEQKDTPSNPRKRAKKKKGINVLLVGGCLD